ncbi:uncharacterized protein [Dermacentor albipictus]|uniref:uncharacterized protein n=1 Tax=Dermacentor albipictus TaxID=60249 RepID=UPI0038FC6FBC
MAREPFLRPLSRGRSVLLEPYRTTIVSAWFWTRQRMSPFRMRAATAAYLLTYAGSMCQWPYEYRFYDDCGLATHDVYVILGIQQLAVLLGPYLVAWLGLRRADAPVLRPKATVTLCLLATALACEVKRAGLCWETCFVVGLGPSTAVALLDLKDHVLLARHLQVYATMLVWAVMGVLVDVYGYGVECVYSLASALYATAMVVILLGVDASNDMVPSKPQGVATAPNIRMCPEWALRRFALLLEDTEALTTCAARFLLEAVAVLNRAVFEMSGPYACGRMVTSLALIFLFRQCADTVASSIAVVTDASGVSGAARAASGAAICLSAFASSYRYSTPARPEHCTAHAILSFGTTVATAGDLTPPWHRSALAGKS